ncbi:MAG: alpha/beta fold hydrolase [Phenylobacterium sp.]|uniref:alpha/beta hydrolase n=1 Tax=Phenylobacterium sp. TaxID=1871053 RepID=UPI001A5D8B35|nr:alpha/beta fold hydrolase [Phenylobacterium sp.]MBL8771244.1 alpha/beta fold hydrolase [Phenylobacterium sp.]
MGAFDRLAIVALAGGLMLATAAAAQQPAAPRRNPADPATWTTGRAADYRAPADVAFRTVSILSEGVRLHGEMFAPKAKAGQKLPTIIMGHGWGGTASGFRADAVQMARAGYQVLAFDYRGWGESDSRVVLTKPQPNPLPPGRRFTAEVEAVRGYVDPSEQTQDWFNVLDWAAAEPTVDAGRIGIRGSSFSGGLVVYVAARDERVKALVSQVGSVPSSPPAGAVNPAAASMRQQAARLARGEVGYPEPGAQVVGGLIGAPIGDKLLRWTPGDDAPNVRAASLFIIAENEELFDNRPNAILASTRVKGPSKLVTLPGIKHYGVYSEKREEAVNLAIAWFDEHLK